MRWKLVATNHPRRRGNKVGGLPNWLYGDESPATVDSTIPLQFLLQIESDFRFPRLPSAPPQIGFNMVGEPAPTNDDFYWLFAGTQNYFYGTTDRSDPLVYCFTQK